MNTSSLANTPLLAQKEKGRLCVCVCLFVLQIFSGPLAERGAEPAMHFRGDRGLACIIGLTRGQGRGSVLWGVLRYS